MSQIRKATAFSLKKKDKYNKIYMLYNQYTKHDILEVDPGI